MKQPTLIQAINALPECDTKRDLQRAHAVMSSLVRNASMLTRGLNSFEDLMMVKRQIQEDAAQLCALANEIAQRLG